jgi:hypothetical protein
MPFDRHHEAIIGRCRASSYRQLLFLAFALKRDGERRKSGRTRPVAQLAEQMCGHCFARQRLRLDIG